MKAYNVYYKGGYIGYVLVPEDFDIQEKEVYLKWLAGEFSRANKHQPPDERIAYEEIKSNLTIEPKDSKIYPPLIFKRQVFNNHELGDDYYLISQGDNFYYLTIK